MFIPTSWLNLKHSCHLIGQRRFIVKEHYGDGRLLAAPHYQEGGQYLLISV